MLTAEGCEKRRQRLWAAVPAGLDALVVGDPSHLTYLVNYFASPFLFVTVESSALLILTPDRSILVADNMLQPFLDQAHADEVVAPTWYDCSRSTIPRREHLAKATLDRLATVKPRRVGVELTAVPAAIVAGLRAADPSVEIVDIAPVIRPLRRAKDADEVEAIKFAIRAGEAGQAAALAEVRPGMTEIDAYLIVQNAAIRASGTRAVVYGDFASGPRTGIDKGGPPTTRVIQAGDLLLLDFSVIIGGYRGDFTNTFAVGGPPTDRQRELFDACVAAMRAAEGQLRPGAAAKAVDQAVRDVFEARGLLPAFPHHAGHGLGLGHPEPPYLIPGSDETLVAGDVITIEPGLYLPDVGGVRIEHDYLITPDGFETLSHHQIRLDQ